MKKREHQIDLFRKYPIEVQTEWFNRLVSSSENTEWGKKHGFGSINSFTDFQQQVPLQDYESIKPFIERIKKGEQNILWPTEVKWFAKSSGTESDKSKFIPVSKESLEECHYKGGKDLISIYYNNVENSKLFSGKSLMLGGSSKINSFNQDSYYGDLSAIIMKNLPWWAEFRRIPSLSIALMDEWEEKMEKMAHSSANENVVSLSGVPSWGLVLLKRILEIKGVNDISQVWPNLELFVHGGVSFKPYQPQFESIISSSNMHYMETYNASEGFFGIQDDLADDGMLLMLDYGIFYEFIPANEFHKEHPITLQIGDVKVGEEYALVISTNAGLWRYKVGDTITFTSITPYKVKVTGRIKHYINAFGEEMMVHNVENALEIACTKAGASIKDYTVAPVFMTNKKAGAHEWVIEFEKAPKSYDYFMETLDNALKSNNSDYEAKRYKNMALLAPKLVVAPKNTYYSWMKTRGKLGGQNKVPRLYNNRTYINDILEHINKQQKNAS